MIKLLNIKKLIKGLQPVTTTDILTRTQEFHEDGLASEKIFGAVGTADRKKTLSYIDLNTKVIHPEALRILLRLDRKINDYISTEKNFKVEKGSLIESEDGVTGITEFIKAFPKIKFRGGTSVREKLIEVIQKAYKDGTIFIDQIPVIPPDFRPIYQDEKGNWTVDPLNDIYITILRRAFQIKSAGAGSLYDLLNYGLQTAVNNHDNYIRVKLQKKQGLIRQQMLGKRTDFSGRAVITPEPKLKINEIGIPLRLAVSIFEPFIIYQLLNSGKTNKSQLEKEIKDFTDSDLSIEAVQKVFKSIKAGDEVPDNLYDLIFKATERAIYGRVVLAKRDPVLHTESYRAYNPILVDGNTIKICTMQVGGHNADFDGDQMAIYHPITNEAQKEAREKMMRATTGTSSTEIAFDLSKEMWAGLYILTKDVNLRSSALQVNDQELENIKNPYMAVKYRGVTTTAGKAIFNSCLPRNYIFITDQVTKKLVNGKIIPEIFNKFGQEGLEEVMNRMEKVAFKWSTIMSPSMSLDMLELPKDIKDIKKKLESTKDISEADKLITQAEKLLEKHLKDTGLGELIMSGSAKGWGQPRQILITKGIISDPEGNLSKVNGSFSSGLDNKEFFQASSGARKGQIDRAINTADTGYMSRKLAYLLNGVEADRFLQDCKTKRTLNLKVDNDIIKRSKGRYVVKNNKVKLFDEADYKVGDLISLRSPIFCESKKICHTCYGKLLERHKTPYIGILAAQIIGERGTQLIMKTFHTGGAVSIVKKDMISDIINNDPIVTKDIVKKYLKQDENNLVTSEDCLITIDMVNYSLNDNLIIKEDYVWVKSLICKVEFNDSIFNIILDYPVELPIYDISRVGKILLKLNYKKGQEIIRTTAEAAEMKGQILYVERLIGGREIVKDASHLFRKLLRIYGPMSGMDIVHLEVLISQCLRDKNDTSLPARLGKTWDPVLVNIKTTIFSEGFVQGLAFEDINKAINTGLISDEKAQPSILERVLTGEIDEEVRKRK